MRKKKRGMRHLYQNDVERHLFSVSKVRNYWGFGRVVGYAVKIWKFKFQINKRKKRPESRILRKP